MFVDSQHILDDMESNDDGKNEHLKGDDGIMEFDGHDHGANQSPYGWHCKV
jgi:hypothetical protein